MSNKLEEILGKSIDSTKALKAEILNLRNSIKDLGTDQSKLAETNTKLNAAQAEYDKLMNAGKQSTDFAKDSIIGMEKEYKNLYNTYRMLSEEQRNSDFGKNMAESLNKLSESLNASKKEVGNYKDNIGRYTESAMAAFKSMGMSVGALEKPMQLATAASNGLGKSLKALIANPIGAVIMAIVLAFKALQSIVERVKEAINSNEEAQMKLKVAMASFQPILDGVSNAFDKLGQFVVKLVEKFVDAYNTIRKLGAAFTDFIGITNGAKDRVEEQINTYTTLAKAQNDYILRQREVKKANAADKAKVEELRDQAASTTDLNEKIRLLTEAKEIQAEIDQRNLELAEENLRILQEEAKLTANDAEANEKLTEAEAKVSEARAAANANARTYSKQLTTLTNVSNKYTEALKKEKEELDKVLQRLEDSSKTEIQKLTEKYKEEKALLEKYHKDTTQLTKEYNDKVTEINTKAVKERKEKERQIEDNYTKSVINLTSVTSKITSLGTARDDAKEKLDDRAKYLKEYEGYIDSIVSTTKEEFDSILAELGETLFEKYNDEFGTQISNITELRTEVQNYAAAYYEANNAYEENMANTAIAFAQYEALQQKKAAMGEEDPFVRATMEIEAEYSVLQAKIDAKTKELENFTGSEEERLAIETERIEAEIELEEKKAQRIKELNELSREHNLQVYNSTMGVVDSIGQALNSFSNLYKAQIEDGKLTEKQVEKKKKALKAMAEVQRAVGIATVIADTAAGIMGIWRGYATEKIANAQTAAATGPAAAATLTALNIKSLVSAIANTAALATSGAAQLAAIQGNYISQTKSISDMGNSGGGAGASGAATPYEIDSTPYSYTRQLQTYEEEDEINKPIYVRVTDIEDGLENSRVRTAETTF